MDLRALLDEVGTWPVEDRLRLIEEVWDGIASTDESVVLGDAQRRDLQRRLDAYRDNPKAGSPWEEVEVRLRGSGR